MHKEFWISAAVLAASANPACAEDWLQFGYDTAHSGFNRNEHSYPTRNDTGHFYHYALPSLTDTAPVYLSGVATSAGTKDLLFLVSKNGTIMALDANSSTLNLIWSKHPTGIGTTVQAAAAVDPNRQYVYAYGQDGKVHKYQVGNGNEITGGGWPQVSTLKPDQEKGASGLSIATAKNGATYLYSVTSGYIDDQNDYQGHVTAIDLGSGAQKVFNAQCSNLTIHFVYNGVLSGAGQNDCQRIGGGNSGIWGRPGAIYDAGSDRMFITTGNGRFDPTGLTGAGMDWGDTVLALNPDGSGAGSGLPLDSYTPTTYGSEVPKLGLEGNDADFGSVSLAIVPAPQGTASAYLHIGVQGGKDGCVRLLNLANLSGQHATGHVGGELQALNFPGGSNCATGLDGPEIKSQPAVWVNPADGASWVYVTTPYNGLAAYKIVLDGAGKPSLSQQWTSNSGTSPIVAGGVVYYLSGTHVKALDAVTGASIVADTSGWATTAFSGVHWQSPILVGGRLYFVDGTSAIGASQLWVYRLDGLFRSSF